MTYCKKGLKPPSPPTPHPPCLHWVLKIGWIGVGGGGDRRKRKKQWGRRGRREPDSLNFLSCGLYSWGSKGLGWLPKWRAPPPENADGSAFPELSRSLLTNPTSQALTAGSGRRQSTQDSCPLSSSHSRRRWGQGRESTPRALSGIKTFLSGKKWPVKCSTSS